MRNWYACAVPCCNVVSFFVHTSILFVLFWYKFINYLCYFLCDVEIQSNSPDFAKGYKELMKVRVNLKKAGEAYDKKMQAYTNSLASYLVVEEDMRALKEKLEQVCCCCCCCCFNTSCDYYFWEYCACISISTK